MLKNILKLKGAVELTANEQKTINGASTPICDDGFKAKRCTEFGTVPAYWNCIPSNYVGSC
ncbi:hypothetical protein [Flavobacterium ginsenosidimutans]|uniref:hypothetical protein n=1 Tax=Flavobacterium ginsenosidimutans TaxID=687844 RepID=UPI003D984738